MIAAERELRRRQARNRDRLPAIGDPAVAELTAIAGAPAANPAAGEQRAAVTPAERELGRAACLGHIGRHGHRISGFAIAELTEAVVAPAPQRAAAAERAGVLGAGGDPRDLAEPRHHGGLRDARIESIAKPELAVRALAPATDLAGAQDRAGMACAGGDIDDAAERSAHRLQRELDPRVRAGGERGVAPARERAAIEPCARVVPAKGELARTGHARNGDRARVGAAGGGSIPDLAVGTAAPARDATCRRGAGVAAARRDRGRGGHAQHRDRRHAYCGRTVAELAVVIEAPASRRAIGEPRTAVAIAERQLRRACERADGRRTRAIRARAIAELTIAVRAPAPHAAIGQPGTRMIITTCDLDCVLQTGDRCWYRMIGVGAVAELTFRVAAPAARDAVAVEGARMQRAERDLGRHRRVSPDLCRSDREHQSQDEPRRACHGPVATLNMNSRQCARM